jgi:hypothetical protein
MKLVTGLLLFQVVVAGIVFKDWSGDEVAFWVSAAALLNLVQVSAYLQQSPESDADDLADVEEQ